MKTTLFNLNGKHSLTTGGRHGLGADGHRSKYFIFSRHPQEDGESEDLAGTSKFLSLKASDFITGQIIYVDGGILATIGKPSNEV